MKKLFSLLLVVSMLMGFIASASHAEETVSFTDSAGRTVEIPKDIQRIAPSGALSQIFLFALAPEYFVGLSTEWSASAEEFVSDYYTLPILGNFYGSGNLNLEELAALDPQLIIDVGEAKGTIAEDMDAIQEQVGIPVIHIDAYTATYAEAYRTLGAVLGLEERGEELAAYCEEIYARTEAISKSIGDENKKELLYCLSNTGLNVIAKGSYHGEVLDMLSNNLAVINDFSSKGSGDPVDMEQLLLWDPEFIVFAPDSIYDQVQDDPIWQELRAISEGNYVKTPSGPYNWLGSPASVQRYLGMIWLCDLLYPDACTYSLQEEVARYYQLFYHCELTQDQYDRLIENAQVM